MNMADDETMENGADVDVEEIDFSRGRRGRPRRGEMSPKEKIEFDQEEAIAEFISKEKDAGAVMDIRRKQANGKYAHLVTMALGDWDKERIAETYGGGEYKVLIKKSDGRYGNQFNFNIDHLRKPRTEEKDSNVMEAVAKALTANQPSVDQFKDLLTEQQSRSDRMFALMMQQSQENTKMMIGMMTAMAQGRPQNNGTDPVLGQIISSLLAHTLKEKHQGIDQLVDGVVKLKQIAEGGRPVGVEDEAPGGGWLPKLLEFLPQVLSGFLAAKAAQTGQPVPVQMPVPAQPLPQQPSPAQTRPVQPNPEQQKAIMVSNYIQMLIGMAEQGVPVEQTYAKFEPMCSDEIYGEIADFLLTPDWWEKFSANNPKAIPHKAWFEGLSKLWLDNFEDGPTTPETETTTGTINAKVEVIPEPKKKEKESDK
jgi:hypothetical protein